VRVGVAKPSHKHKFQGLPPRCSTWSGGEAGRYVACSDSIELVATGGARTTLLGKSGPSSLDTRWTFLAPSPDGRTLLLEQDVYACGTARTAYFLPASGGKLEPVVSYPWNQSEPLGWLRDGSALVAAQSDAECEGMPESGIYRVRPEAGMRIPELVVGTSSQDATLWGSTS
jgi:hypothetical protein